MKRKTKFFMQLRTTELFNFSSDPVSPVLGQKKRTAIFNRLDMATLLPLQSQMRKGSNKEREYFEWF